MLTASIESGGLSAPVRIRNLSEGGAMLDGAALPTVGASLVLRRADLEVGATVVWQAPGRCGIKFDNVAASVDEWVAGKCEPSFRQQGQARVDAIQRAVRAGELLPSEPAVSGLTNITPEAIDRRLAQEVDLVRMLIDGLGEELGDDGAVLSRHHEALQRLDRASQVLAHITAVLNAPDRIVAARAVPMEEVRERLMRF